MKLIFAFAALTIFAAQSASAQDSVDIHGIGTALSIENSANYFTDDTGCKNGGPMNEGEFLQIVNSIKTFDDDKARFNSASLIFRKSCLTSAQIIEVCNTFQLEPSKLEFAKFAFSACVDPTNYKTVANLFKNTANTKELNWYIAGK